MDNSSALSRTIAAVRIATSVFFLLFGEYKVAGPGFAHGGFQTYLQDYIANSAVSFYRPFLSGVVLPHAVFFGYAVGVIELLVGISLLIGLWVRPACVLGILFLLNMLLATWWEPGHGVPVWRYFGARTGSSAAVAAIHHLLRRGCRTRLGSRRTARQVRSRLSLCQSNLRERETHDEEDYCAAAGSGCVVLSGDAGDCANAAARRGACGTSARCEDRASCWRTRRW